MRLFLISTITYLLLIVGFTILLVSMNLVGSQVMADLPSGGTGVQSNCPPNGCRSVNFSMTMTPVFLNSTQDKYLQFRFYDSKNNETIPDVSFFLNVTKNDQKLMYDFFHTHSGMMKLKFESGGSIGNWTVKGNKDPALGGWMNDTGPIDVQSPIFVESGSYHIHVEVLVMKENEVFASWATPKFDSYVIIGNSSASTTPSVPEFGALTGMIIAISIIGVIIISTRFRFIQKVRVL